MLTVYYRYPEIAEYVAIIVYSCMMYHAAIYNLVFIGVSILIFYNYNIFYFAEYMTVLLKSID